MQRGRAIAIVLALSGLVAIAGCDEGGGSLTLEEYGNGNAETLCAALQACYGSDLLELFAGADCVGRFSSTYQQAVVPQLEAAIAGGTLVYDGARARECIDRMRAAGCDLVDRVSIEACEETLVGTVEPGGPCALGEECAGDSYCRIEAACPGTCQARVASGSACSSDDACQGGLRCFGGTCQAPARATAACGGPSGIECAGGLVCLGGDASPPGTCRTLADAQAGALGAVCDPDTSMLCEPGLTCALTGVSGGTTPVWECGAAASAGAACNLGFPEHCPFDHTCEGVMPATLDFEGTCTPLPRDGEACRNDQCADGARCAGGTCRAVRGLGGACMADADCISTYCDAGVCAEGVLCTER